MAFVINKCGICYHSFMEGVRALQRSLRFGTRRGLELSLMEGLAGTRLCGQTTQKVLGGPSSAHSINAPPRALLNSRGQACGRCQLRPRRALAQASPPPCLTLQRRLEGRGWRGVCWGRPGQNGAQGQSPQQDGAGSEPLGNDPVNLPAHQDVGNAGSRHFVTALTATRHLRCWMRAILHDGDDD